jgi:hypothetical protein
MVLTHQHQGKAAKSTIAMIKARFDDLFIFSVEFPAFLA